MPGSRPGVLRVHDSFEAAVPRAANLGDDADTTAAVCGQVAGAYYGESAIPSRWLERLVWAHRIRGLADDLQSMSQAYLMSMDARLQLIVRRLNHGQGRSYLIEGKLRNGDLVGTFRAPSTGGPFPGVLALGGSDGGTPEYFLNLLVPEGLACLAIAYWVTSDTQPTMAEIPLERLERGLRWLIGRSDVVARDGRVAVVGASRGGELVLLLAASFPDSVGPVVAYTPSSVVWFGLDFTQPVGATRSTWTRHGKPLPHLSFPPGVMPTQSERGLSMLPLSEAALDDRDAVDRSAIAVESAHGPLLLVSGGDDRVWATGRMCEMIVRSNVETRAIR